VKAKAKKTMMGLGVASVAVLFGLCLVASWGWAQPKAPADFTFSQGKDSPGNVTFSHEKHAAKAPKCTDCHTKVFKMKKGTADTSGGAMHKETACGSCHNGQGAFAATDKANCEKCHKK
jgi:c(7)-type cytochrome triheme protein